jgi:hypothetical protein
VVEVTMKDCLEVVDLQSLLLKEEREGKGKSLLLRYKYTAQADKRYRHADNRSFAVHCFLLTGLRAFSTIIPSHSVYFVHLYFF